VSRVRSNTFLNLRWSAPYVFLSFLAQCDPGRLPASRTYRCADCSTFSTEVSCCFRSGAAHLKWRTVSPSLPYLFHVCSASQLFPPASAAGSGVFPPRLNAAPPPALSCGTDQHGKQRTPLPFTRGSLVARTKSPLPIPLEARSATSRVHFPSYCLGFPELFLTLLVCCERSMPFFRWSISFSLKQFFLDAHLVRTVALFSVSPSLVWDLF